jgi:uncharacterized membrane protein YkvA (DUF1232 family)
MEWYRNLIANPKYRWWIIIGSLIYILSPIDISPDFIPIFGQIDDAVVVGLLVAELVAFLKERSSKLKDKDIDTSATTETKSAEVKTVDVNAVTVDDQAAQ